MADLHRLSGPVTVFYGRPLPEKAQLTFALKYEGLDFGVLKRLFAKVTSAEIEAIVRAKPTGSYGGRIWFLYKWLMGSLLDLPRPDKGTYVTAIDPEQQWDVPGENSPRHSSANCPFPAAAGSQVELRYRGRTTSAGSHSTSACAFSQLREDFR
jgi:hypothetical protein